MTAAIADLKEEYQQLIRKGNALTLALAAECGEYEKKELSDYCESNNVEQPSFKLDYETWYSSSCAVISVLMPDRLADFKYLYRNDRRKEVDFLTYTLSDAILGLRTTRGWEKTEVASARAAIPKLQQQVAILSGVSDRLEKKITDLAAVLQADIFADELDAAQALLKAGHLRAAGALSGVVLERHLQKVAVHHGFASRKKNPTIAEFNEYLKGKDLIDIPIWRKVQYLADIRNLCDHPKEREPKADEITSMLVGVKEVISTTF